MIRGERRCALSYGGFDDPMFALGPAAARRTCNSGNDTVARTDLPNATAPAPTPVAARPGNLAELSAHLRAAAAEIADIAAQAVRRGYRAKRR